MHNELMKKATQVREHYKRLDYQYQEGLIPQDFYLLELDIIRDYLQDICYQMEKIHQQLQEEQ